MFNLSTGLSRVESGETLPLFSQKSSFFKSCDTILGMKKQLLKDGLVWGLTLWFIGYVLGFVFYALVPASLLGWVIMPFGIAITLWVLIKYIKGSSWSYYAMLGVMWAIIAIVLDYFLLVQLLKPADGYYKPDVYLYYLLTLILPLIAYWFKTKNQKLA